LGLREEPNPLPLKPFKRSDKTHRFFLIGITTSPTNSPLSSPARTRPNSIQKKPSSVLSFFFKWSTAKRKQATGFAGSGVSNSKQSTATRGSKSSYPDSKKKPSPGIDQEIAKI
jgi:hypothetical protein